METILAPIAVVDRTSLATAKECWKSLCKVVPSVPASSAKTYGLLHLAKDLGFAQDHRIEPTGHTKGMTDGITFRIGVQIGLDLVARQAMILGQPLGRHVRYIGREIDFGPVAGREDRRLLHRLAARQVS
jgi:hypothetical protein